MKINIREFREKKGLTQVQVANVLGVTSQYFQKIEKGNTESMTFEMMEILCNLLDCEPNDIFKIEARKLS